MSGEQPLWSIQRMIKEYQNWPRYTTAESIRDSFADVEKAGYALSRPLSSSVAERQKTDIARGAEHFSAQGGGVKTWRRRELFR